MKKIALVMGLNDYYEHGIARGVVRFAKTRSDWKIYGYGWMFSSIKNLSRWDGDGIIARVESEKDARFLSSLKLPLVDVAGAYTTYGFPAVTSDDEQTGRLASEHLLTCGFTRFAFCGVTDVGWSKKRYAGFMDSIRGTIPGAVISRFTRPLIWWEALEKTGPLDAWLRKLPKPLGLFACNDTAGLKVITHCTKNGIQVPEEIAVLGVDNEDIPCELADPPLSSIALKLEDMGFQVARHLCNLMALQANSSDVTFPCVNITRQNIVSAARRKRNVQTKATDIFPKSIVVPPKNIVQRESTKIFNCPDPYVAKALYLIHANVTQGINVRSLLQELPISRRSLETRFKKTRERTIHAEIISSRLNRAKDLLRNSNLKIDAVAFESGFPHVQRFYEVFKDKTGCTPMEYRKNTT